MSSLDRTFNEKRDFIRMKINSQVNIRHNNKDYVAICKDLSGAGMLLESETNFTVGDLLDISIGEEGGKHMPFNTSAEVSRMEATDNGKYIVGLSIKEIME